jgi:GntR family transcriptional regulator, vanillate catabolism transcriptional regulator
MADQNLEYKVYQQIKEMMLNFDIVPGQRIVITDLAEKLGVSRTPVKMALIMLLKDGFIDHSPRQSSYTIHQLSREELDGLHEFREILELGAIGIAIKNLTPDKLKVLESKAENFKQAAATDERELRFVLDLDFHAYFVDLAGSTYLTETYRDVYQRFFMRRRVSRFFGERYAQVLAEHDTVVEAFRRGDAERAKQAISAHAAATKDFMDSIYF